MNQKSYGLGLPTSSTESGDRGRLPSRYRDRLSESHGRTDGLTKNNSPESVVSRNASPAGGQDESWWIWCTCGYVVEGLTRDRAELFASQHDEDEGNDEHFTTAEPRR